MSNTKTISSFIRQSPRTTSEQGTGIPFTKMHGLGNDFIVVDAVTIPELAATIDWAQKAESLCDRRQGVGADGVLLMTKPQSDAAQIAMRIFNADGSQPEMCGNGIRCVCKYAVENELCCQQPMRIETGAGLVSAKFERAQAGEVISVTVDMGRPRFGINAVQGATEILELHNDRARLTVDGVEFSLTLVSMGNPHAVVFVGDHGIALNDIRLADIGRRIERHPAFPKRINVQFVEVIRRSEMTMRTWERGSGETQACGTGACAVCSAGVTSDLCDRHVTIHLPGGDLEVNWHALSNHMFMTGPASYSFTGVIE